MSAARPSIGGSSGTGSGRSSARGAASGQPRSPDLSHRRRDRSGPIAARAGREGRPMNSPAIPPPPPGAWVAESPGTPHAARPAGPSRERPWPVGRRPMATREGVHGCPDDPPWPIGRPSMAARTPRHGHPQGRPWPRVRARWLPGRAAMAARTRRHGRCDPLRGCPKGSPWPHVRPSMARLCTPRRRHAQRVQFEHPARARAEATPRFRPGHSAAAAPAALNAPTARAPACRTGCAPSPGGSAASGRAARPGSARARPRAETRRAPRSRRARGRTSSSPPRSRRT